jgi:DNA-binding winged helix-turn-helix (wHTH) protein
VWDGYLIEQGTMWGAMSELREILRDIDLTVKHVKGIGYRLENLSTP